MQISIGHGRPTGLQENIRSIVRLKVIPSIGTEDTRLDIRNSPISANIEDFASHARTSEIASDDGNRGADASRSFSCVDRVKAFYVAGIQERQTWCCWLLWQRRSRYAAKHKEKKGEKWEVHSDLYQDLLCNIDLVF